MPSYLHPGVYMEEIPSGVKTIEAVGTSTAAFIGYTVKGPVGEPTFITKWDQYEDQFGGIRDVPVSKTDGYIGDPMGLSVYNFFLNGGSKAYIVRSAYSNTDGGTLLNHASKKAYSWFATYSDASGDSVTANYYEFEATNEGAWGNSLRVQFTAKQRAFNDDDQLYTLEVGTGSGSDFESLETIENVSFDPDSDEYLLHKLKDGDTLISASHVGTDNLGYCIGAPDPVPADLSVLNEKKLKITVNGGAEVTIAFEANTFDDTSDMYDVAAKIQELVNEELAEDAKLFQAYWTGAKLVLTALPPEAGVSSVVVTTAEIDAPGVNAASTLDLGGTLGDGDPITAGVVTLSAEDMSTVLAGGADGEIGRAAEEYNDIFELLLKYRDVNIILLPDHPWDSSGAGNAELDLAIAHCEKMQNRMVIIDPPMGEEFEQESDIIDQSFNRSSTYTALYYPWVAVSNPYYNADTNPGAPTKLYVNPSAFAAGMWAKIADRRGVWKAPAGVEAGLLGAAGLQYVVENDEQDYLNPQGVNAFRTMPGYGSVIWGARTLATKSNPEWRYVPVRRTAAFLKESIYQGIQWSVFEPNDHRLWAALRTNIDSFMNGLFRVGAFQGEKASDAYFVRCGLGDTMTQGDIDRGQVIVIVGFAPLKPAEFVIVRLQQKVGQ